MIDPSHHQFGTPHTGIWFIAVDWSLILYFWKLEQQVKQYHYLERVKMCGLHSLNKLRIRLTLEKKPYMQFEK